MTYQDLIERLVAYRLANWRDDHERADARLEAMEFVLHSLLEKLSDEKPQ